MSNVKNQEKDVRKLKDLRGIGRAMLEDFELLGVRTVATLSQCDGRELYERLNDLRGRQDPCVLDTFQCAVAQARDPHLPAERKNWWYWSRLRKSAASAARPK